MEKEKVWQAIADRKIENRDPRFELDQERLTKMAQDYFEKGIAMLLLGRPDKALHYLRKNRMAVWGRIKGVEIPDYYDMLYWFLESWLTEDRFNRPDVKDILFSLHFRIMEELERDGTRPMQRVYWQLADMMDMPLVSFTNYQITAPSSEQAFTLFCKRLIDLARLWLLSDSPHILRFVDTLKKQSEYLGEPALKLIKMRLKLDDLDIKYIREGDLALLKRTDYKKYSRYMDFLRWENTERKFFRLQLDVLDSLINLMIAPADSLKNKARNSMDTLFQAAHLPGQGMFDGIDLLEQIQWAYVGSRYLLGDSSKKPLYLVQHYLGGML